jgi:hypothetical protein
VGSGVGIPLRGRDACVARDLLDDADVDALLDEESGGGVPGIVETAVPYTGLFEDGLPLSPESSVRLIGRPLPW